MSVTEMTRPSEATEAEEPKKGGKKKLLVIVLVVALLGGGAGYWFFLKPSGGKPPPPDPGAVVKLDAIQVNLAANHYLRIGIALQATKDAGEEVDGSKALDATIQIFSGRTVQELARPAVREKLKKELEKKLDELYEHHVMGVYFHDFVTQ